MVEKSETVLVKCSKCHGDASVHSLEDFYWVECDKCSNSTDNYYMQFEAEEAWNKGETKI